ncbi:helix-turn-helix domain-containing protein [Faecalicatena contorta]|uniref:Helix-turn-helix domain-containing protein n=1 Tax=Faecalicatena contorta TaxID=39482 RepID=A0A315ZXV9_9FIRM|nr:AraC family transcriptional regulator [Faecalicatena contorta]PWJ50506.1 helix-turn-helix protein [Faecalicatena contorta]SUQ13914.1 Helix-turn-helix domain-containing protein [Faecalicatena contorta]
MKSDFDYFVEIMPTDMYSGTKATIYQNIAIFEPKQYVIGKVFCVDDYHFILFFEKSPVIRVKDVDYRLEKGDLLVVQPWDKLTTISCGEYGQCKYIHIAVKRNFFQKISTEIAAGEVFTFQRFQGRYSHHLLDLIGDFKLELKNYGNSCPQMLLSISTQIVFQLIRDLGGTHTKTNEKMNKDNPCIQEAIRLMQECYATNISIIDICNLIYLSPNHFNRMFKEHTGRTPHQYLIDIRLEKAKELLRTKDFSIEDTARLCGFINAGHFAVTFKRSTQLSPSEYRKIHSQK